MGRHHLQDHDDGTDSVVVKRVIAYRVDGTEKRASRKALRIASEYASTVAGRQPTANGPARIEGTGKGTGTYFVSPDGTYLGGDWQLRSALLVSSSLRITRCRSPSLRPPRSPLSNEPDAFHPGRRACRRPHRGVQLGHDRQSPGHQPRTPTR